MTSQPRPAPLPPGPESYHAPPAPASVPVSRGEVRSAMLAYLGVPFTACLVPLAVFLVSLRGRPFARSHAGQALNLSVAACLYTFCLLIAWAMLALDSASVATIAVLPLAAALWVIAAVVVVRAAAAASHGQPYSIPRWLRVSDGR